MIAAIIALAAGIAELVGAIISVVKTLSIIAALAAFIYVLFTKDGGEKVGRLLGNIVSGGLGIASTLIGEAESKLLPVATDFTNAVVNNGGKLKKEFEAPLRTLAKDAFTAVTDNLERKRNITPADWKDLASEAMADAFGFGLASHGVAVAYESLFPEKLNTLNGLAPLLGELAGFAEVTGQTLRPMLSEGIGVAARYDAASKFRAHLPDLETAATLHARGLITEAEYQQLAAYAGIAPAYAAPLATAAYRAISPFQLIRALETGVLTPAEIESELSFAGVRPESIDRMKRIAHELALQPYKQKALASLTTAFERGTVTEADFANTLAQFNLPDGAEQFIQLDAAYRKLEQLSELYRKSVDEAYQYGELTDAEYVPRLEAIGIAPADANAHYAVASIKKRGKAEQAAQREETRLQHEQKRLEIQAANREFLAGRLNLATLTAALIASGEEPRLVPSQVAIAEARRAGNQVRVYNLLLARDDAKLLQDKVAAIQEQTTKKLITPELAKAQLLALQITEPFAEALASKWAATGPKTILPI